MSGVNSKPDPWPWPAGLDGPTAAPGNHRVLFENDRVRVIETRIRAGETTPVHTHGAPMATYLVSGSHFIRRDENGVVLLDSASIDPPLAVPTVAWSDFLPAHSLENTGPDDLLAIGFEIKD